MDTLKLVTADVVADQYGVTVAAVRRWTRAGIVPAYRPSQRVVRYDLAEVRSALAQRGGQTPHGQAVSV
jgi:phage terminase Nu1 subunit (DNA packaging protein)